eukprot:TRINITY_DN30393_c1_g1_i2.p1 TRINITY_DN30393_c1_g1~~TRINITY_DN30393_c1_g1_i2.p1  ORF type:complete len:293 (-),score=18.93 TRINITY_DN30393_c1_g1_i2:237-1115(-)
MDKQELVQICLQLFPHILNLYWSLVVGVIFVTYFDLPVPQIFKDAVVLSAARGKLWKNRPTSLAFLKELSISHSFFSHFYVVGVLATTVVLLLNYYYDPSFSFQQFQTVRLVLFEFHVLRRLLESWLMFKYPADAKMHVLAYAVALSYYVVVPLSWLDWSENASQLESAQWSILLGVLIFALGSYIQFQSHWILSTLSSNRPSRKSTDKKSIYVIPNGGLFRFVSCPHYFGEIIIYVGFWLLGQGCYLRTSLVLCWVVLNLLLAADSTQQWYQEQFGPQYPKARKKLIPLIY